MRIRVLIFMISLALWGCQLGSPVKILPSQVTLAPQVSTPAKQVVLNTLSLVERWRWSGSVTAIAVAEDRITIVESDLEQRITVFDIHSGKTIWQSDPIRNIRSLAADEKRVYIGTINYVQAFDLETGQELWRGVQQSSMKRGGFMVYSKEDKLEVYDILEPIVYILDLETGQIASEISKPLFFRWNELDYSIVRGNYLFEARDAKNNERLWSYAFPGYINGWPVVVDEVMLLNSRGQIFGIEARTGQLIWQTPDTQTTYTHPQYVTGVAVQDNLAYTLSYDAAIVGFNPETGEQVGIIKMLPNRTMEDDGGEVRYYTIGTSGKFVAVYYGNSQELIVFERDLGVNKGN